MDIIAELKKEIKEYDCPNNSDYYEGVIAGLEYALELIEDEFENNK